MNYKLYKLRFTTAVHFGIDRVSYSDVVFSADRLFSAFCSELVNTMDDVNEANTKIMDFVEAIDKGEFLISDALPYIGDNLYVPKPLLTGVCYPNDEKLKYLPYDKVHDYIRGSMTCNTIDNEMKNFYSLGSFSSFDCVGYIDTLDNPKPYTIGSFTYNKGNGLYFILGYEDESLFYDFDDIMSILGYIGIGGKLSSGFGKFEIDYDAALPENFEYKLSSDADTYMSLSVCLPKNNELENALKGSCYNLIARTGFVSSDSYDVHQIKTLHCFSSGSTFVNKFKGSVVDMSEGKGSHPVYKYAKPFFMNIK